MTMTERLSIDGSRVQDEFHDAGWTDGLPIVPPTPDAVRFMLDGAGVDEDFTVGHVAGLGVEMSAEHAAIAAVMAGCRPDYFPVVLAALSAALDPAFNLAVVCTSTGGAAICVLVSGPITQRIGMNARHGALGSGNRANATIGRAVRLAAVNLLRTQIDDTDGTSLGHPGRYSFCFAESDVPGWSPSREQFGYTCAESVVTVLPAAGPLQIANHLNANAEGVVASIAAAMTMPSLFTTGKGASQFLVVLGPEHRASLQSQGWDASRLREELCRRSRVTVRALGDAGIVLEVDAQHRMKPDTAGELATVESAHDVLVATAGGEGAGWSALIPSWAPKKHALAVTRRVAGKGEPLASCGDESCFVDWSEWERS